MADDKQQQPGVRQQQQAKQQPVIEQPDEVQLPPQGPPPEGPGELGKSREPPFVQQQAPSYATLPCIIPNCAYATSPDYYPFQKAGQAPRLAKIKSLAAMVLHPATRTVRLHEYKQFTKESTKAFATRVKSNKKTATFRCPATHATHAKFRSPTSRIH